MKYCRLAIRPVAQQVELIERVLEYYKSRKYVVKGNPRQGRPDMQRELVTNATVHIWETQCKPHVVNGCVADPPHVQVYRPKPNAPPVIAYFIATLSTLHAMYRHMTLVYWCVQHMTIVYVGVNRRVQHQSGTTAPEAPATTRGTIMLTSSASTIISWA